ncbi:MAG: RtcB family protein [Candidatus Absconditabacteria bacterium]
MKKITQIEGKPVKIYAEILENQAFEQFKKAMRHPNILQGALMPDAHTGYTLPIGGVVASKDYIFPSFIGYDIGCGMSAIKLNLKKHEIEKLTKTIFHGIYDIIPTGFSKNKKPQNWNYKNIKRSKIVDNIMSKDGLYQIGTLGTGNHFIEISYDENNQVWITIHSGSRGLGHTTATYYMKLAAFNNNEFVKDLQAKHEKLHKSDEGKFAIKVIEEFENQFKHLKATEGYFGFETNSVIGKQYIDDMNFCLEFALENRKIMIEKVAKYIYSVVGKPIQFQFNDSFINRNHNHADLKDGLRIHRKGATHAEEGMMGIIPGNMRDGSFVVRGLGNQDSLFSSSHGAGRVLSRNAAKESIHLKTFQNSMEGIIAKVGRSTIDESPFAYKDIFQVMKLQKDLVKVIHHLKPLINIKA